MFDFIGSCSTTGARGPEGGGRVFIGLCLNNVVKRIRYTTRAIKNSRPAFLNIAFKEAKMTETSRLILFYL